MRTVFLAACVAATTSALVITPRTSSSTVSPQLSSASLVALVTDPTLDRDSCGSVQWGDRVLWTCRDTGYLDGDTYVAFFSSSASYTNLDGNGSLALGTATITAPSGTEYPAALTMYGDNHNHSFFPIQTDDCGDNQAGSCSDGTRWAVWPNSPPLVTSDSGNGTIIAYTWIKNSHLTDALALLVDDPSTSLYRISSVTGENDTLPAVELVDEEFYQAGTFAYGNYGGMVINDTAYLYAQSSTGAVALSKAPVDSVEDVTTYQYMVDGSWTTTRPSINDTGAELKATAGGQGTFYFNQAMDSYVWIGQGEGGPDLYVTTAPTPWGPWSSAEQVFTFPNGDTADGIGAYSMQAHPEFSDIAANQIYVSYTKANTGGYETPLYLLQWA
ncbi:hypothetical protein JCM24511_02644 [Saitozyma sp. JCM 24511]|nr:hypothetical protein JCM24511_02644 [Saitozyma sp. JCM 24511]